jgi:hypothetical protein
MAWPLIFNQAAGSLLIFQLTTIAILAVKKSIGAPFVMLPLPFMTLAFIVAAHNVFWKPMEAISLLNAANVDAKEAAAGITDAGAEATELYLSPSFKVDAAEHTALMAEMARMKKALDGDTSAKASIVGEEEAAEEAMGASSSSSELGMTGSAAV